MIHIETIDLSLLRVTFPRDLVGIVVAQPYLPDDSYSGAEPFQITPDAKPRQLAVISRTFAVARLAQHEAGMTHFTLFPEYSIPGLDGVDLIQSLVRRDDWPVGTIVIGGTDALSRDQYLQLLDGEATHVDQARNGRNRVPLDQWVNCAITWVKHGAHSVERWIQPKLHPAAQEMNITHQHMFCGSSVYIFKGFLENGAPYRFGTLICKDWIAPVGNRTPCEWILQDLQTQAGEHQLPLTWLFIIQRNESPSNDTFLIKVRDFFDPTRFPSALRERACLIFANTSGIIAPGATDEYGAFSLVSSPQASFVKPICLPTFSDGGPRFRDGSHLLSHYKDSYFRERGACIHSFAQVNPGSVIPGAAGQVFAVMNARVYSISGAIEPRAPDGPVPAAVKWLNDELDSVHSLSTMRPAPQLAAEVNVAHADTVGALRVLSSKSATGAVRLAAQESKIENVDEWGDIESKALQHIVNTVDIMGVGFPAPVIGDVPPHATLQIDRKPVDLLSVCGASHEECIEHSRSILTRLRRQAILVSRDPENTPWLQKFDSFLRTSPRGLGDEVNITDPYSGSLHIGYQDLLQIFRRSTTPVELGGLISAALTT